MQTSPPMKLALGRVAVAAAATFAAIAGWLGPLASAPRAAVESGGGHLASGASAGPVAVAARRVYLVETAHLRLTKEGESSISERGQAIGTFRAPVSARLQLSPGHVTAIFTIYPRGGSITGRASARFVVKGSTGYYGGTLAIVRGTGAYRHASGSNIGISGTIDRLSFALSVKANGWMSL